MRYNKITLKRELSYEILLIPALVGYILFFIYPTLSSFYYSITNWNQFNQNISFIGFENYKNIFKDQEIVIGIKNSFKYAFLMTIFQNVLAIPLAVILDKKLKSRNLLRMIFFAPAVLSSLVVGFLWSYIMAPTDYGLLNKALGLLGMAKVNWLGNPDIALYSIMLTQLWQWTGWAMVIYLANLQSIDVTYYEAAKVDGATGMQTFWKITLPLLAPSVTINSLMSVIGGLKVFDIVFAMTSGGPGHATETITTILIKKGFTDGMYGYGSAIAVVLFVIIGFISIVQLKFLRKWGDNIS